ncbi:hypothetical protein [Modicisalibacter coralii]|uniref:hypothetical protein n=1 Tax=Modicisalibacter coralii TaxID=2304602 RepID=UPI00100B212C|nr:hypothetical protein [Halomonas coralii]
MKGKILAVTAGVAVMLSAISAEARQFNGNGQAACVTEKKLDQLIDAATQRNKPAINYLLQHGCIIPKAGVPVTVLDTTFSGKAQVRVFANGRPIELWTVFEALSK